MSERAAAIGADVKPAGANVDLDARVVRIARSRHLYDDSAPKTAQAMRTVELLPERARILRIIEPLQVMPGRMSGARACGRLLSLARSGSRTKVGEHSPNTMIMALGTLPGRTPRRPQCRSTPQAPLARCCKLRRRHSRS